MGHTCQTPPQPSTPLERYKPAWDRRLQYKQYGRLRALGSLDVYHDAGEYARALASEAITRTMPAEEMDQWGEIISPQANELAHLPRPIYFARLLGMYGVAAKLDMGDLQLSLKQIGKVTGLSRSYICIMHRWLIQIGWLHVDERRGWGTFEGRERALNKSATRALSVLAYHACRIWRRVVDKASCLVRLLTCKGEMRTTLGFDPPRRPVRPDDLAPAPVPKRPPRARRRGGGLATIGATVMGLCAGAGTTRTPPRPTLVAEAPDDDKPTNLDAETWAMLERMRKRSG